MHKLTDRQQAKLLTATADAKDATEQAMDAIRATHQPAIDDLKQQAAAKRKDAEANRIEAKAKRKESETADEPEPLRDEAKALDAEAETMDIEAEALDEQADEYRQRVNRRRDLERQIGLVEAVQAVDAEADESFAMESMFSDLEIRARHDIPGSQYVAKTLTEQAQIEAADALDRGLSRLRDERDALDATLAG